MGVEWGRLEVTVAGSWQPAALWIRATRKAVAEGTRCYSEYHVSFQCLIAKKKSGLLL